MNNQEDTCTQASLGQLDTSCQQCGSKNIIFEWVNHTFAYGSGENPTPIEATVPVITCKECETEYLDREGEKIKHDAVCKHLGVLNPSEIKNLRNSFGYNQERFAEITKFGVATLREWERGASIQSPASDNLLRLLSIQDNMNFLRDRL